MSGATSILATRHAERLRPDPALRPERLDRLVFERGFPITEEGVTTFAYRGDVDGVDLLHFGIGLPEDLSFERVDDSNWWLLSLSLPAGTRLEYRLGITDGGHRWDCEDPLNPIEARNPFGQNSVCRSHGYAVPPWAEHDPGAPVGQQRSLTLPSRHLRRAVPVHLYLPASFSMTPQRPYPLVVMHDGTDYFHYADASTVLDNLIHRSLTPETVVAFVDPGERLTEYADDERHARFVVEELVPYLESHLPLTGGRDHRCLGGASFGAVAALSTAYRFPDAFGRLLLQSGSFDGAGLAHGGVHRDDALWHPVKQFVHRFQAAPARVADRIYLSCGVFEALICDNRAMRPLLADTGTDVVLEELSDGHTWGCWRDSLGSGLTWLFEELPPGDVGPHHQPSR